MPDRESCRGGRFVSGVRCPARLDEQQLSLLGSELLMLDTHGNKNANSPRRVALHLAIAETDRDPTLEHEEQVVGVVVVVPDELALTFTTITS